MKNQKNALIIRKVKDTKIDYLNNALKHCEPISLKLKKRLSKRLKCRANKIISHE